MVGRQHERGIAAAAGIPQRDQHLADRPINVRWSPGPLPQVVLRGIAPRLAEVLHYIIGLAQEVQGDEDLGEIADLREVGEPSTIQLGGSSTSLLQQRFICHGMQPSIAAATRANTTLITGLISATA